MSHLWKRKIIFKFAFSGDMSVSRRVYRSFRFLPELRGTNFFVPKLAQILVKRKHAGKIMGKELLPVKKANHTCYVAFW